MTAPHPALRLLATGRRVGGVDDEPALVRSVSEHRMVAVALAAHERGALELSPSSATTLAIEELAERQVHLQLWEALARIEEVLEPLGAQVAVLKGIATEARWYDQLGERRTTDLDLLLAPDARPAVAAVVAALDPDRGSGDAIGSLVRRRLLQHVDLRFGAVPVDLHVDPLKIGIPTRQLDEVWSRTEVLDTPHGAIRVLSPEVELVALLLHLNKDGFALLGPFLDIARILERASLDWDRLRRFVRGEGLEVPVWKSLGVVIDVLGLTVPEAATVTGVRAWTWERLWGSATLRGTDDRREGLTVQPLLALHAAGRAGDQVRELRRQVLPQRELLEVAGRLHPGRSYLGHVGGTRLGAVLGRPGDRSGPSRG